MHRMHRQNASLCHLHRFYIDLAIIVTSQIRSLKNYFWKFPLIFELDILLWREKLKVAFQKTFSIFNAKILVPWVSVTNPIALSCFFRADFDRCLFNVVCQYGQLDMHQNNIQLFYHFMWYSNISRDHLIFFFDNR